MLVTVGGTIPADDIPELKELGVAEVFTPGAPTQDIIDFIRGAVTVARRGVTGVPAEVVCPAIDWSVNRILTRTSRSCPLRRHP